MVFHVFITVFVISSLTQLASTQISLSTIQDKCPNDKPFCAAKAASGSCFGKTLKADVLQNKCPCSCDLVHYERIQKCCSTVGIPEMKFCMPLCRYNTTAEELGSTLGLKCLSQLTTWAYCAADATDQSECCANKGIPVECRSFCQGDVPTCDMQSIFNYEPCIKYMGSIMQCQREGLTAKPKYDPEWLSTCDWEGR